MVQLHLITIVSTLALLFTSLAAPLPITHVNLKIRDDSITGKCAAIGACLFGIGAGIATKRPSLVVAAAGYGAANEALSANSPLVQPI